MILHKKTNVLFITLVFSGFERSRLSVPAVALVFCLNLFPWNRLVKAQACIIGLLFYNLFQEKTPRPTVWSHHQGRPAGSNAAAPAGSEQCMFLLKCVCLSFAPICVKCPCFDTAAFHSLRIGTYVPHAHTHARVNRSADTADFSSFPVTKALEVWKQLQQSFCYSRQNPHLHFPHPSSSSSSCSSSSSSSSLSSFLSSHLIWCISLTAVWTNPASAV